MANENYTPIERRMFYALNQLSGSKFQVTVIPQHHILTYLVDFCVYAPFIRKTGDVGLAKIVIECDGHDFHEKTKQQAARDKKRDRDIQALGFVVLRFTGSEIYRNIVGCYSDILNQFATIFQEKA